jgi:alcohol dehydrogenase, propanol-preferring
VTTYPLERAQDALDDLRAGRFEGAAVIVPS